MEGRPGRPPAAELLRPDPLPTAASPIGPPDLPAGAAPVGRDGRAPGTPDASRDARAQGRGGATSPEPDARGDGSGRPPVDRAAARDRADQPVDDRELGGWAAGSTPRREYDRPSSLDQGEPWSGRLPRLDDERSRWDAPDAAPPRWDALASAPDATPARYGLLKPPPEEPLRERLDGTGRNRLDLDTGPHEASGPHSGPIGATGPVRSRAALRAQRQAAEAARKRSGRRSAPAAPSGATASGLGGPAARKATRRRGLLVVLAVMVVAMVVLGVYTVTAPGSRTASTSSPTTPAVRSTVPTSAPAPTTPAVTTPPAPVVVEPPAPVRVPITVLNNTGITGLAVDIGRALSGGGWEVRATGNYVNSDIALTTVYFTDGDADQQQAALQLQQQFPTLAGPVPRFFDVPDDPAPGLVVVATGNWRP